MRCTFHLVINAFSIHHCHCSFAESYFVWSHWVLYFDYGIKGQDLGLRLLLLALTPSAIIKEASHLSCQLTLCLRVEWGPTVMFLVCVRNSSCPYKNFVPATDPSGSRCNWLIMVCTDSCMPGVQHAVILRSKRQVHTVIKFAAGMSLQVSVTA